jgi:Xaa-Pro aminopeptidase
LAHPTHQSRRDAIGSLLIDSKLDGLIVTALPNIRYLTGFTGSNAALLVTPKRSRLFTDPRYTIQAGQETGGSVTIARGPLWPAVMKQASKWGLRKIGFERRRISFQVYEALKEDLPLGAELNPVPGWIEEQRMTKSADEVEAIRRAVSTNSRAYTAVLSQIRPGLSESDVAAELEYQMRREGAEKPAFDTIVAAGPRSALPHARPTSNRLAANQLLLIDMGVTQEGYTSDMTRVVALGKPKTAWKKIYQAVLEAQLAAIATVREGVAAGAVDRAARQTLRGHELEKAFVHSTGHGLGLEIHEAPRIGKRDNTLLKEGMVITIEPGAYVEGTCGVRIEDTVLVTRTGCEVLTPTSKELTIL